MGHEVRESFRAPFVESARKRHQRIATVLGAEEPGALRYAASELHCLSGEAHLLDFGRIAELARLAEDAARMGDREQLVELLRQIESAIESVAEGGGG
jgi:HPt (histidine-containing phosphotransfer) domain-containing protein